LLPKLQSLHDERVQKSPEFQDFVQDVATLKAQREKTVISLNETERRNEMAAQEKRAKARGKVNDGIDTQIDDGLQSNERSLSADLAIEKNRKSATDVLQNEAAAIVNDLVDLQNSAPKRAAN
jgi:carboxyl-terminal processing protease